MKNIVSLKTLLVLVIFCMTTGFTSSMYDTYSSNPDLPKGDPDPEKGLYIRNNSTAEAILAESSSSIRLSVSHLLSRHPEQITSVDALLTDREPKKLTLSDGENESVTPKIYGPRIYLSREQPFYWKEFSFWLFDPPYFQNKENIENKLKEFGNLIQNYGWSKILSKGTLEFKYPTLEEPQGTRLYGQYEKSQMLMRVYVEVRNKFSLKNRGKKLKDYDKNPEYNIVIVMRNQKD